MPVNRIDSPAARFEEELNAIAFDGMPLGVMLSNEICVQLLLNNERLGLKQLPKTILQALRTLMLGAPNTSFIAAEPPPERYALLTSLSTKQNYLNQITAVSRVLGRDTELRYLVHDSDAQSLGTSEKNILRRTRAKRENWLSWYKSFRRIMRPLRRTIRTYRSYYSFTERLNLLVISMAQTQRAHHAGLFLEAHRPEFILTEYDKNLEMVSVIAAAGKRNIPTFSLLHGLITYYEPYIPPVADKILVWGEFFKDYLVRGGLSEDRISVTGAPHIRPLENDLAVGEREYMTLATNPFDPELMKETAAIFCQAYEELYPDFPGMKAMVRLHPSEKMNDYAELTAAFPQVLFDQGKSYGFEDSIRVSRIVITFNSAYGVDALMKGRQLVQLGKPEQTDFFTAMVEAFGIDRASSITELVKIVRDRWEKEQGHALEWQRSLCLAQGDEAAERIAKEIQTIKA